MGPAPKRENNTMTTVILVIHLLLSIALVGVILLLRSEGGVFGIPGHVDDGQPPALGKRHAAIALGAESAGLIGPLKGRAAEKRLNHGGVLLPGRRKPGR